VQWNLPNIITMIRIAMIPVFMVFIYADFPYASWIAVAIFAAASLTDGIDGYVARKYNQVTTFGKFIDPLADKLLVISALLIFVDVQSMPVAAAMIVITRELAVTALRTVAISQGVTIAAGISGKVKTFTQICCIILMLTPFAAIPLFAAGGYAVTLNMAVVTIMVLVTIWSGIDYFYQYRELFKT
jgi:CDP-diacylglycerol--glycerol-3-phosphate 3-phosphatidyltransferase